MNEDNNIKEFMKTFEGMEDENILKNSLDMLRDMIKMNKLKREIEQLEETFYTPEKSIAYFFAQKLNEQEIVWATERISGMVKRMELKNEKK